MPGTELWDGIMGTAPLFVSPDEQCSGLSARPAPRLRLEDAGEQALEARHEAGTPRWPAGPGGLPEGGRPGRVIRCGQIRSPVRDGGEQRTIRGQEGVGRAVDVSRGARPGVGLSKRNQSRPDRVALDVAHGRVQVGLLQGTGVEAPLPEVPHAPALAIAVLGIPHVGLVERPGEGVDVDRDRDGVDVIRHEAVRPDLHAVAVGSLGEPGQVLVSVLLRLKDRLPEVPPLGDVMGHSGGHDASEARHGGRIGRQGELGKRKMGAVPTFPECLREAANRQQCAVHAYVLMTNHGGKKGDILVS